MNTNTTAMSRREQSICNILKASVLLFRQDSYHSTSVRQIAEKSGVALGMINHYFGSKEYLGAQVLSLLQEYILEAIPKSLSFTSTPILYDLTVVRAFFDYLLKNGYWAFYLDSLECDFFFNHLSERPTVLIEKLKGIYHFEADADTILLYSRYMPYMMEKTLVLKKEEGLFPSISYDEIPYLICQTAMRHFIPEQDIRACDQESKRISAETVKKLLPIPPNDMIVRFARQSERFSS